MSAAPSRRAPAAGASSILVVEDVKDTRDFFIASLSDAGYRVLGAASFNEALRILRVERSLDAIIVDYNLGDGSGAALIHQARNEGLISVRRTPTIICTAYSYVELPPNVAILHKPLEEADLLREVEEALAARSVR